MSRNLIARRAGLLSAAIAAGVLATAAPALADVSIEPPSAAQGSGENVHFKVTNTGPSAITRVKLVLPADTPVAEVFPLSTDNWAPQITPLKLTTPLTSIHAGTPVTETAAAITWIAVQGKALKPGATADLAVALGPLPLTSSMTFRLEPTYAAGSGPALPPAVLTLTEAAPGQATGHTSHGGTAAPAGDPDDAAFAAVLAEAEQGPGFWSIAGWIVAALAVAGAAVAVLRGRHREPEAGDDEPDEDENGDDEASGEDTEPVTAGARASGWRYSG